jgi:hypothetical protein
VVGIRKTAASNQEAILSRLEKSAILSRLWLREESLKNGVLRPSEPLAMQHFRERVEN